MKTRTYITGLVSLMVNAVVFGIGAITVLSIPYLNERAKFFLPAVILASFAISPFLSWWIAPKLRARNWEKPKTVGVPVREN